MKTAKITLQVTLCCCLAFLGSCRKPVLETGCWGEIDELFSRELSRTSSLEDIRNCSSHLSNLLTTFAFHVGNESKEEVKDVSDAKLVECVYSLFIGDMSAWRQRKKMGVPEPCIREAVCKRVQAIIAAYPIGLRESEEEAVSMVLFLRYARECDRGAVDRMLEDYARRFSGSNVPLPFVAILNVAGSQLGIDGVKKLSKDERVSLVRLQKVAGGK